ncbi:hypothetical protein HNQ49_004360, partial [Parapusillimonas granuli]|nr:hypothetical protein [Parapusillimonas granuli]
MVKKFHQRYGIGLTRHQKAYARGLGQASAALTLWSEEPGQLHWVLMLTPGENLAYDLERLKEATTAQGRCHRSSNNPQLGSLKIPHLLFGDKADGYSDEL